eukprot:COSAG01_NODE_39397_length_477_cov_0.732804_1_plen_81_part_01
MLTLSVTGTPSSAGVPHAAACRLEQRGERAYTFVQKPALRLPDRQAATKAHAHGRTSDHLRHVTPRPGAHEGGHRGGWRGW